MPIRACRRLGQRVMLPPHLARRGRRRSRRRLLARREAYEAHRIALGVPRGGLDFIYGDAFPHEADMDQLAGVDFDKGCYVGQEVVSRVEHRASARSRVVPIAYDEFAPERRPAGDGGRQAGRHTRLDRQRPRACAAAARPGCGCARRRHAAMAGGIALRAGEARLGDFRLAGRDESRAMSEAILHPDGLARCPWPKQDPLYVAYHDEEWGVPEYDDRALFEKLILDGFQAGLSWITILRKRDNFRRAFDGFAAGKDRALYAERKIESLMKDAGIVRNRSKIEGAVPSARAWLEDHGKRPGLLAPCCGTISTASRSSTISATTKQVPAETELSQKMSRSSSARGFKFVGPTIVYAFMQAVGMVNDHLVTCHRHAAVREARAQAMSKAPDRSSDKAPRAWQRMLSGRRLDLLDPSPLDVEIEDIAHGLARVARWNGQTKGAHIFSVAQHSLLVEALARAKVPRLDRIGRLAVLLHDAPEYVIGDMISPFKAVIGDSYKAVEKRLLGAIHLRFGLPAKLPEDLQVLIKTADRSAAYLEATRLAGFADAEARKFFGPPPKFSAALERDYLGPWPAEPRRRATRSALKN